MTEVSDKLKKPTVHKFYEKNDEVLNIAIVLQFLPQAETEIYFIGQWWE